MPSAKGATVSTTLRAEPGVAAPRPRPADECPWPRPFPEGFDSCAAFLQRHFIPQDNTDRPLTPTLTCRHFATRPLPGRKGAWYGACEIGDEAARGRWLATLESEWFGRLTALRRSLEASNRSIVTGLWSAKAQQVAARQRGDPARAATADLHRVAAEFLSSTRAFLSSHRQDFERVDVDPDAIMLLIGQSLDQFVSQTRGDIRWEVAPEVLAGFPERVQVFFRPHRSS
jgi:hypothetical protein